MKRYLARHLSISRLFILALLTLCFVAPPFGSRETEAAAVLLPSPRYDHTDGIRLTCDPPPIGFVPGERLRVTVAHVSRQAERNQSPPNVRVGVWLLDSSGRVIAQSAQVQVPLNEFRSFDFDRVALNLSGEPDTGRLQVRACQELHVDEPYHFTADPKGSSMLVSSLELIDNSTGRTTAHQNNLKQIGVGRALP